MRVAFEDTDTVWRRRGRPRKPIPDTIRLLADQTYRTGKVGRVVVEPGEEGDAKALLTEMRRYAKMLGRKINAQRDGSILRWRMVDLPEKGKR